MSTKLVNGERVDLTSEEEVEHAARATAHDPLVNKRKQLIELERDKALEALIAVKRIQINTMNETALDVAIAAGGLS